MRHTEFWSRLGAALGESYARFWAERHVIAALGGRTPTEALEAGVPPKQVWAAVHEDLALPASEH